MVSAKPRPKEKVRRGIPLPGLRRARENAGLSLRDVEARTVADGGQKVWRSTINEIERGNRGAYPKTAKRLADVLKVEVEDLRGGE